MHTKLQRLVDWCGAGRCAALGTLIILSFASPTRCAAAPCIGDCDGDGRVTIDEVVSLVGISLGAGIVSPNCPNADANSDGQITIDEILIAVGYAIGGCPSLRLSGRVFYYSDNSVVPGVELTLDPGGQSVTTDSSGRFLVDEGVAAGPQTLFPQKTDDAGEAITAFDASVALQAAQGLVQLPLAQQLACDVDGDARVTQNDAALILEYAARLRSTFPTNERCGWDWLFIPASAGFGRYPLVPTCLQGDFAYTPLSQDLDGQDFNAILIGDCSGNWPETQ